MPKPSRTEEQIQQAIKLYESGLTLDQSAKAIGCHKDALARYFKARGVITRDTRLKPSPFTNHDYFSVIDTDEKAWLLGFIGADGNVYNSSLNFGQKREDEEILLKIRDILAPQAKVHQRMTNCGFPKSVLSIRSEVMAAHLARHGIHPRKSLTYQPWNGPTHLMPAYFRGMMDGDGSWSVKGPHKDRLNCYLCGTLAVCQSFSDWVFLWTGYHTKIGKFKNGNIFYAVINNREIAMQFSKVIYEGATICLARKEKIVKELWANPFALSTDRRWRGLTNEKIMELYDSLISSNTVAAYLGLSHKAFQSLRTRRGIDIETYRKERGIPLKFGSGNRTNHKRNNQEG